MKQVGKFGIWVPEDTDAPDAPTQLKQLAEGTESTDGVNDLLDRAGAQSKKSIISAEQSRTNTAFGVLGTPDEVTGLVLPEDGLIFVAYQAAWKSSVGQAGRAALFLNNTQLKMANHGSGSPLALEKAQTPLSEANRWASLATDSTQILNSGESLLGEGGQYSADVTTGQLVGGQDASVSPEKRWGGVAVIFAAAGTYAVSVRFRATSGSVTAKGRKLWVWSKAF